MNPMTKILIVEDEMVIGANISLQLTDLGYEVTGIVPRAEEALACIRQDKPNIIILDIQLKGDIDGIEFAKIIQQEQLHIPVIFLTANSDEVNFNRAKETKPYAFISKPFRKIDLKRSIELILNLQHEEIVSNAVLNPASQYVLNDCIFVRHQEKLLKVSITDILYIEAERNYCRIFSKDKEYLLVTTLKEMDEKLPNKHFIRVHRSFIINVSKIDEIANNYIVIGKKAIPVSKTLKEELMNRLQMI